MHRLCEDLNEAQKEAVLHEDGPLLVVAGAGSGKTRVITRRIARLVASGIPEWRLLGLTFTNKAAREMAERVEDLVPGARVRLSTFHSACARFLRIHAPRIGFTKEYTIYDTTDRDRLLKSLCRDLSISPREVRPSVLGARISRLKNEGVWPHDFAPDPFAPFDEFVGRVYGPYMETLRSMNAMDFDDLLLRFLHLLDEEEDVRRELGGRFLHILVDEFQDTNRIQYEIVKRLAAVHGNLCVVGDPDQSIYRFRGAEVGNILSFPEDWPGTRVLKLERNYRSTANILSFAQRVIACNRLRHEKVLLPVLDEGEPVRLHRAEDAEAEARWVRGRVLELLDRRVDPGRIAVFYRARFLSRGLETIFRRGGIPFQLVGDLGFFERKEVKDLLSFLKVCVNPRDLLSFERVLNVPPRGIGKVSAERLRAAAARAGLGPAEFLRRGEAPEDAPKRAREGMRALGGILREAGEASWRSVAETLEVFLDRTSYIEEVCRTGGPEDADREENVGELLRDARRFDEECEARRGRTGEEEIHPVAGYLAQVSLLTDAEEETGGGEGRIQLMTVHAAKGLEFDHVFVIGLEEGIFPHGRSIEEPEGLEEERRLFYVAATRARKSLHLSLAERRTSFEGGSRWTDPSRFLIEGGIDCGADPETPRGAEDPAEEDLGGGWGEAPEPFFHDPDSAPEFRKGERVRHASFGLGKILKVRGRGARAKVEVLFPSGVRTLLLEYANLQRVEEV